MNKTKITFMIMLILFSSALTIDSSSLDDEEKINYSSTGENMILDSQAFIDVIQQNGNIGNYDSFNIKSTVTDSSGSTYIVGNLKMDKLSLGTLEEVNLNDAIGRITFDESPLVAKVNSNGVWDWVFYPVPSDGSSCGGSSSEVTSDDTQGTFNSIALSKDERNIGIAGHFTGCYVFSSTLNVYNTFKNAQKGMVVQLNAETGSISWVSEINFEDSDPNGEIILSEVTYSDDESNPERLFVGGKLSGLTVGSAASGLTPVTGDNSGDAYFMAIDSSSGSVIYHVDSCTKNDGPSSQSSCNNNGMESISTIDVYQGKIVLGISTLTPSNNITLFGSPQTIISNSMTNTATGWVLDESTLSNYAEISQPLDFNLDKMLEHSIVESIVVDEQLRFLINQWGNSDTGFIIHNLDKITNQIYKSDTIGSSNNMIPNGFIHGDGIGTYVAIKWRGSQFSSNIFDESSQLLGSSNIVNGFNILDINNHGNMLSINLPYAVNLSLNIANSGTYTSIIGINPNYNGWMIDEYVHDADMDGIPDNFDSNAAIPNDQDADGDSILNNLDNCPSTWNYDQLDFDNDLIGDACDSDLDGDTISNNLPVNHQGADNCPYQNSNGNDADGDGCLDIPDSDEDGVLDAFDICPGFDDSIDDDDDGVPNNCDTYPFDWDNDGANDTVDVCQGYADYDDSDGDGIPYGCDDYPDDFDNDGIIDSLDNCISTFNPDQKDSGGESLGDACDYDIDGDGVNNSIPVEINATSNFDKCPYVYSSTSNDFDLDGCDDEPIPEQCDVCDNNTGEKEIEEDKEENNTIIDPKDIPTAAAIGGAGFLGGGLIAFVVSRLRGVLGYIGIDDGLELLKHLPRRKKKDGGSDHYFKKGLIRQQEMTISADKNLDDYIEDDN
ncbi:MAG: hypothetical protein CBE08_006155 [Euryarchaeota archaeon TMED248]|nr:MAG: hypothetical protein CBE08_006155 [Euryarchaeota archaeon TMED248]